MRAWIAVALASVLVLGTLVLADPVGPFVGKEFRAYPGGDDTTAVSGVAKPANTGLLCDNDGNCVVAINSSAGNDGIINFNAGDALITWDDSQSLWVFDATATRFVVDNLNSFTVLNGTASGGASASGADGIVLDSNLATGISILTPTNIDGKISFNNDDCSWQWDDSAGQSLMKCGTFRFVTASLSGGTPNAAADDVVVDTNSNSGISVLAPAANSECLYFGTDTSLCSVATTNTLKLLMPATKTFEIWTGQGGRNPVALSWEFEATQIESHKLMIFSENFNAGSGGTYTGVGELYQYETGTIVRLNNADFVVRTFGAQTCLKVDAGTSGIDFADCAGGAADATIDRASAGVISLTGLQVGAAPTGAITESHCGNVSIDFGDIGASTAATASATVTNMSANAACACSPRADWADDVVTKHCYPTAGNLSVTVYNADTGSSSGDLAAVTVDYCCFEK